MKILKWGVPTKIKMEGSNAKDITGNSGELIVQLGGDDMTYIRAGTVAAEFVDYFSNLI